MAVNPERISAAQSKLSEDPHDTDSWVLLIKHAQCRSIDEARETYERLVEIFPTCGRYWKLYIEQEVTRNSIIQTFLVGTATVSRACLHAVRIHIPIIYCCIILH